MRAVAWMAAGVVFAALARGLPAETFFVGDPGVKLIAARQAHPERPLEIPLPTIGGERVPYVEPFFVVHGNHSHAITSEVFPVATAPFIALFGIRGAYLFPALGFFLVLAASSRLAQALDPGRRPLAVILTVALGTPLLFYGLEFWEHAPAVGLATLATVWLLGTERFTSEVTTRTTDSAANRNQNRDLSARFLRVHRGSALVAGVLFGIAILLRPEAMWFFAAVIAASRLLTVPLPVASLAASFAGVLIAVLPLALYSIIHFGAIVPPHVGSQSALLTSDWLSVRSAVLSRWFGTGSVAIGDVWGLALLVLLTVGWVGTRSIGRGRSFLAAVAIIDILLVILTAPNDGGGQWGPRYLLFAFVPAAVLVAGCFDTTSRRSSLGVLIMVLALAVGVWAQREGYRELRGAKRTYGRVLDFVRAEVLPHSYAVTDLWWLDQVAAAATDDRWILFASSLETVRDILGRLAAVGIDSLTLLYSRDESPQGGSWLADGCYRETGRSEIPERSLVAIHLQRC